MVPEGLFVDLDELSVRQDSGRAHYEVNEGRGYRTDSERIAETAEISGYDSVAITIPASAQVAPPLFV